MFLLSEHCGFRVAERTMSICFVLSHMHHVLEQIVYYTFSEVTSEHRPCGSTYATVSFSPLLALLNSMVFVFCHCRTGTNRLQKLPAGGMMNEPSLWTMSLASPVKGALERQVKSIYCQHRQSAPACNRF